jgi:PIN domain nuclease of toxin-antitoxin system
VKILIDTHCWLWLNQSPQRFSKRTLATLADPDTERWLSVASVWELGIKVAMGKLALPVPVDDYVTTRLATTVTQPLSITASHALRASRLPAHHKDPFDRMIIAQAAEEGAAVLSADAIFRKYHVELMRL